MSPDTFFLKPKEKTVTVGFRVDPDEHEIIKKAAYDLGFPNVSEFLRHAANEYLKETAPTTDPPSYPDDNSRPVMGRKRSKVITDDNLSPLMRQRKAEAMQRFSDAYNHASSQCESFLDDLNLNKKSTIKIVEIIHARS